MSKALIQHRWLKCSPEVAEALAHRRPVLALESTIISHGMPWPQNLETVLSVEAAVREAGAVPATIAIMGGKLCVGLDPASLEQLARSGEATTKCSRRDIACVLQNGRLGATTVAATMIIAHLAGIRVFATGGIGGVHRGAEQSFDVSADLQELARTPVAVVCAGPKAILDIGLTLEYLETHGVPVLGFGTDDLPAFYSRDSGYPVDYRFDDAATLAAALQTHWALGLSGGAVIAQPIPEAQALDRAQVESQIAQVIKEAQTGGVGGKALTPFLLQRLAEESGGRSLEANIALVHNNARLGAHLAVALAKAGPTV